mmetsp:Transcript_957/g.1311  ORF Transcript_957/g.1311 Transcript_957/m.1311 type:complete len:113 (+) Transcript_957:471-809(+)
MLEMCTTHLLISYPDFIQITQVLNTMDRVTEPRLETTAAMKSAAVDPELINKYMPSYRPNQNYNFSDKRGFQTPMQQVTEAEAKRALRTLVDFMRTEVSENGQGMTYEPVLT